VTKSKSATAAAAAKKKKADAKKPDAASQKKYLDKLDKAVRASRAVTRSASRALAALSKGKKSKASRATAAPSKGKKSKAKAKPTAPPKTKRKRAEGVLDQTDGITEETQLHLTIATCVIQQLLLFPEVGSQAEIRWMAERIAVYDEEEERTSPGKGNGKATDTVGSKDWIARTNDLMKARAIKMAPALREMYHQERVEMGLEEEDDFVFEADDAAGSVDRTNGASEEMELRLTIANMVVQTLLLFSDIGSQAEIEWIAERVAMYEEGEGEEEKKKSPKKGKGKATDTVGSRDWIAKIANKLEARAAEMAPALQVEFRERVKMGLEVDEEEEEDDFDFEADDAEGWMDRPDMSNREIEARLAVAESVIRHMLDGEFTEDEVMWMVSKLEMAEDEEEKSSGKGKGKAPEIGSDDWNASLTLVMRARAGRMAPMFERLIQNSRLVGDPSPAEIRELVHMMNRTTRVTMGLSEDFEYEESFQESFDEMDIDDKEKEEEEEEEGPYYGEGKNPYDSFFGVSHLICPHQHPPTQRISIANQSEQGMQDSFRKKDSDKKDKDKSPYNSMYGVSHLIHPHQHSLTTDQYR
jgi:hypothetical protein